MHYDKAACIIAIVLQLTVKSGLSIQMQLQLGGLMNMNPTIDPKTWFNEKWGCDAPVKDPNSPHNMDRVSDLTHLLALYQAYEGELFDALRSDICKRINAVKSAGTKRQREYHTAEMNVYLASQPKRHKLNQTSDTTSATPQKFKSKPKTKKRKVKRISIASA
jgi:hypothetical protein